MFTRPETPAECERCDPKGHVWHIWAAMAWGFCQSIANSPEGIAWGVLLVVVLSRLPRIFTVYRTPLRDPAIWCLLAWAIWMKLTVAWSPPEVDRLDAIKPVRWLITPFLLWPVMGRPWVLFSAIAMGGFVQVISVLLHSIDGGSLILGSEMRGLSRFGQMTGIVTVTVLIALAGVFGRPWRTFAAGGIGASLGALVILLSASRTMMLGLAGGAAMIVWKLARPLERRRVGQIALMLSLGVAALAWQGLPALAKFNREVGRVETAIVDNSIDGWGSHRILIWRAAWDIGCARPWIGTGKNSFDASFDVWVQDNLDQERLARDPDRREALVRMNHAHNALLQAWAEGGVLAVVLVTSGISILVLRSWRHSGLDRASLLGASLCAIVVSSSLFGIFDAKGSGVVIALVAVLSWRSDLVTRGWVPEAPPEIR